MKTRPKESLVALALLALLTGCQGDSGRLATEPESRPEPVPPLVILLEAKAYPSSWAIGVVGTPLSNYTFGVATHDGKYYVSGVRIVWAISGNGGSVTPAHDTTKGDGSASVATITLGSDEGTYTVTAKAPTLPGSPQHAFNASAVTVMVEVRDLADGGFVPASVTVPLGRSVGWRYASGGGDVHNITFEDDPTRPVSSRDLFDVVGPAPRHHTRVFEGSPRTIRYRCTHHSASFVDGEVGTVTVN